MDNKRAIEVLRRLQIGSIVGYTAIDRDDAFDHAIAVLTAIAEAPPAPNADRWWATYHAALSGLCALGGDDSYTVEGAHKLAAAHANEAHGPLVQP